MARIRPLILSSVTALMAALCSPILACSTSSPSPTASTNEAGSPPGPASAPGTGSPPKPASAPETRSPAASAPKTGSPAASAPKTGSPAASAPETGSPMTSKGATVTIHLIALDGQPSWQRAKGVAGAAIIGCNDYLVPVPVKIDGDSPEARAEAALNKLLSLTEKDLASLGYESGFQPSALKATVERKASGRLVIDLKGKLSAAGVCTVPRMKSQIERTAAQFGQFGILVNGSEAAWRCFGDESGNCK